MKNKNKTRQPFIQIVLLILFISLTSMSTCMRRGIDRRVNTSNLVVYDSIYFANGCYAYWYSYDLGSFYGAIGDFVSISNNRANIEDETRLIVSEYIKSIKKVSDTELNVILTVDTYDQVVEEYKGIKIMVSIE